MVASTRPDQCFAIAAGPWPEAGARVTRMVRLSNHGEYEEAARAAEALLAEGVHDVHVVARYLFGVFLARGFATLPAICAGLSETLAEASTTLGPPGEPWTGVDQALVWLLRTLRDRVGFHHAQRDAVLNGWTASLGPGSVEAIRGGIAALGAAVARSLPGSRMAEHLAALDGFAAGPLRALTPRPPPPPALVPAPAPAAQPPPPPPTAVEEEPPAVSAPAARPADDPAPGSDLDSPALRLLRRKLAAFEALMERGDHARAAIVAGDVQRIVLGFDPRVYLPRLFSGFFRRLAAGAGELDPYWVSAESLPARALEQLYQVDLDAFLDGD